MLWKKLIGTTALGTTTAGSDLVHAYAFGGPAGQDKVLVIANWDDEFAREQKVTVSGCQGHVALYELTPTGPMHDGDDDQDNLLPFSVGIALNGDELRVDDQCSVPPGLLKPKIMQCVGGYAHLKLAALTGAFVVLHNVQSQSEV